MTGSFIPPFEAAVGALVSMAQVALRARGEWRGRATAHDDIDRMVNACADAFNSGVLQVVSAAHCNEAVAELKRRAAVEGCEAEPAMSELVELHNRIASQIIASIVKPPIAAGGEFTDVLVLLETVIFGVIFAGVKLGGDELVLDEVVRHVKERLAEQRLGAIEPAGQG